MSKIHLVFGQLAPNLSVDFDTDNVVEINLPRTIVHVEGHPEFTGDNYLVLRFGSLETAPKWSEIDNIGTNEYRITIRPLDEETGEVTGVKTCEIEGITVSAALRALADELEGFDESARVHVPRPDAVEKFGRHSE